MNLQNMLKYLKDKYQLKKGFFCIYGSYATKTQNSNSDVDLLYIYDCKESKLKRTSESYKGIKISFYELSIKDLIDDSYGKYGGFFCGKIFNPHILYHNLEKNRLIIQKTLSIFFSQLFSEKHCVQNKEYSSDEILKCSINIYVDLYPEYFAYIMRLMQTKKFNVIWNDWKHKYIRNLIDEKIIYKSKKGYKFLKVISRREFEIRKIDYMCRFWVYGAISHNSNISFYDFYKNKNQQYILNNISLKKKTEKFLNSNYYN